MILGTAANDNAIELQLPVTQVVMQPPVRKPEPAKGFSMFAGLPKVALRQNKPWRRVDQL
jgi:hypothetical protein